MSEIITLAVLLIAIVLFVSEKIPLYLTAMLAMLAMLFAGILDFKTAFSGFANNATFMLIGIGMIGYALNSTGCVLVLSNFLNKLFLNKNGKHISEKAFILISSTLCALLSAFLNPVLVVSIFMSICDALAIAKGSGITRKNTYMPLAVAGAYGSQLTSISATTIIAVSGLMAETEVGRGFTFFEPALIGIPCLIVFLVYMIVFGYRIEQKGFRFEEQLPAEISKNSDVLERVPTWKRIFTVAVLLGCILMFIFSDFALGAVALAGGAILMVFNCINPKDTLKNLNWSTVFLFACCYGFTKAIEVSGLGASIANLFVDNMGALANSGFAICIIAMICSNVLSNVMSNSATALMLVPIFISIAQSAGAPLLPVIMSAGLGAGMVTATPVCTPHVTITSAAGYKFVDYLKFGGVANILAMVTSLTVIWFVYFM